MTHPEELLAEYVSGSVSSADRTTVETHLSGCPDCSVEVSLARAARSALRGLPEVPAPDGVASRVLHEVILPAARPGWYRWLGAGAVAAAVVALILVSLPRIGSSPANPEKAAGAVGGGSSIGVAATAGGLHLIVQEVNYDQATLDELTKVTEGGGASASAITASDAAPPDTPNERTGSSAELQTALTCVGKAVAPDAGTPFKLILARFDGKASFLAFYYRGSGEGQAPASLVVWIVDGHTCTASGFSTTPT